MFTFRPGQYHSVQHYKKYATLFSNQISVDCFDWEAHIHHLVVAFFNMMALYGPLAPSPQESRLIKIPIAKTNDQL